MKCYKFEIKFLSYSIKDGNEFIMEIYDYILAENEDIAYHLLEKKKFETNGYYARIWPKITDIYVSPVKSLGLVEESIPARNIYHNSHPQPSLFDLTKEE